MVSFRFLVVFWSVGAYTVLCSQDCDETLECASEEVNGTQINCWGYRSCADSHVVGRIASCDGKSACFGATLDVSSSISCEGSDSCALAEINSTGNVYCGGYWSCAGASPLYSGAIVECPGEEGCRYTDIEEADNGVYCFGDYGCRNTKITGVSAVYSRGYRGTYFADIDTSGVEDFSISFDGYFAGYQTHVYCAEDSICNIQCDQSTSCFEVTLYCHGDCIVDCDSDCGFDCPTQLNYTDSNSEYMHKLWTSSREKRQLLRSKHQQEFNILLEELNDKDNKISYEEKQSKISKFNQYVEDEMEQLSLNFKKLNKLNKYDNNRLNVIASSVESESSSNFDFLGKNTWLMLSLVVNGVLVFVLMCMFICNKRGEEYQLLK